MATAYKWTNPSVLAFAQGQDPVEMMERAAREVALAAMDEGWTGPPFDPLNLAERRGLKIDARGDIPDARLIPTAYGSVLQYNPTRPRGRLRFSIAHEIAHTLFPDHDEQVRNRLTHDTYARGDNWQLEVLCNIGAAELLMPAGSFSDWAKETPSIQKVMDLRKQFNVSVEACIIRLVKLSAQPMAAFCASVHDDGSRRVDYVISSSGWRCPVKVGQRVPASSVLEEATEIGFTAIRQEEWVNQHPLQVECVALAPYPGSAEPRVVGLLIEPETAGYSPRAVDEVDGDALQPRGGGRKLLVHVVPNTSHAWGGAGFASSLRRRFPDTWSTFRDHYAREHSTPRLGEVVFADVSDDLSVAHMVAQAGIGQSSVQRLRYAALSECLKKVQEHACDLNATVHMPRIGTGHGGANWQLIRELISDELVDKGIKTTVYRLPPRLGA